MGYGAPGATACSSNDGYNCFMPAVPQGTVSAPTKILGEGWDKGCVRPPTLWGTYGANRVMNLVGSSNAQVQCIEVTDHSNCATGYIATANRCKASDPFAIDGVRISDTTNLVLRNLNIHGLAAGGITFGRNIDFTSEDVRVAANAWVGLSGDLGETGKSNSNSGNIIFRRLLIEWNGCLESYPGKKPNGCWGTQSNGSGWGDGVGFAGTDGEFLFEDSTFRYNTSDGLDVLYHTDNGNITIRRSRSEGNAGNQFKVTGHDVTVENSIAIGNCDFFNNKSFTLDVVHCRALGDVLALNTADGTARIINNTIIGNGNIAIVASASNYGTVITRNNIIVGYTSYVASDRPMAGLYFYHTPTSIEDHNIWFNIHNAVCTGAGSSCVDPMLVNSSLLNPDVRLRPGSPALNSGSASGAPTGDYFKTPRTARGGIDIGAYELP
jgi:hypothetical protein